MLKVTLLTLGNRMPEWVTVACAEYEKRLKPYAQFSLCEIPLQKRSKSCNLDNIIQRENADLIKAIPPQAYVIALDLNGTLLSSEGFAERMSKIQMNASHLAFLIGGPEGFAHETLALAHEKWSLSKLTLTHPLARVTFMESLYRSFCIQSNHPFHK